MITKEGLVVMGSIKKNLQKHFVRLHQKEIAPILPYIAMAIPGMGPIAGNALLRYGLPQLLTAAGSARTSGDINLLNQAMALAGSYAAGPASKAPTKGQIAFDKKFNPQAVEGYRWDRLIQVLQKLYPNQILLHLQELDQMSLKRLWPITLL